MCQAAKSKRCQGQTGSRESGGITGKDVKRKRYSGGEASKQRGGHKGLPIERDVKRRDLGKVDANNGFGNQVVWLRSYRPLISL